MSPETLDTTLTNKVSVLLQLPTVLKQIFDPLESLGRSFDMNHYGSEIARNAFSAAMTSDTGKVLSNLLAEASAIGRSGMSYTTGADGNLGITGSSGVLAGIQSTIAGIEIKYGSIEGFITAAVAAEKAFGTEYSNRVAEYTALTKERNPGDAEKINQTGKDLQQMYQSKQDSYIESNQEMFLTPVQNKILDVVKNPSTAIDFSQNPAGFTSSATTAQDKNGDGVVDARDDAQNGDTNGDGRVNISDSMRGGGTGNQLTPSPPAPVTIIEPDLTTKAGVDATIVSVGGNPNADPHKNPGGEVGLALDGGSGSALQETLWRRLGLDYPSGREPTPEEKDAAIVKYNSSDPTTMSDVAHIAKNGGLPTFAPPDITTSTGMTQAIIDAGGTPDVTPTQETPVPPVTFIEPDLTTREGMDQTIVDIGGSPNAEAQARFANNVLTTNHAIDGDNQPLQRSIYQALGLGDPGDRRLTDEEIQRAKAQFVNADSQLQDDIMKMILNGGPITPTELTPEQKQQATDAETLFGGGGSSGTTPPEPSITPEDRQKQVDAELGAGVITDEDFIRSAFNTGSIDLDNGLANNALEYFHNGENMSWQTAVDRARTDWDNFINPEHVAEQTQQSTDAENLFGGGEQPPPPVVPENTPPVTPQQDMNTEILNAGGNLNPEQTKLQAMAAAGDGFAQAGLDLWHDGMTANQAIAQAHVNLSSYLDNGGVEAGLDKSALEQINASRGQLDWDTARNNARAAFDAFTGAGGGTPDPNNAAALTGVVPPADSEQLPWG